MTLSMTDDASDDAICSSIGAAADSPAVHVVGSNTTSTASKFAQAHAASSIDLSSANVERAPRSSETASLHLPPSGMLSRNSGVEVVANCRHQQYQEHLYMQQMQYIPGMHMPMTTVMPSLSTSPTQQCKHDDCPAFAAMPLPTQATPTFGVGMMLGMLGGGAYSMPQSGRPSASSKPAVADQYDSLLHEIQDSIEDKERWKGAIKLKDSDGNDVDLCDWLGKESSKSRGSVLILSDEFDKSDVDAVREHIIAIAKDEGMILRAAVDNTKKAPRIKFRCYRNGTYKPKNNAKKKQYSNGAVHATNVRQGSKGKQSAKSKKKHGLHARKTNTALPLDDEDRCPFNFIVSWSPYGEERWCIVAQDGCPNHEGHKPDIPSETKATITDVGDEGRQIIKDVLDAGGTPTVAQVMVKKKTGVTLTTEQILRERQTIRHPEASKSDKSPAQKAVEFLQSDKKKSYILMVHEVGDVEKGSSFLTENTNGKRFQHSFKTLVSKGDGNSPSIAVEEMTESQEIVEAAPRRSGREKEAVRDGNDSDGDPYQWWKEQIQQPRWYGIVEYSRHREI